MTAGIAQTEEHITCNDGVAGSIPATGSTIDETRILCGRCHGRGYTVKVEGYGNAMRSKRESLNITLRSLGRISGFSHVYLSDVERGKRKPSDRLRKRLEDILGEL